VIKRAIENERLETSVAFRDAKVEYDEFKRCAAELTSSTIVLPVFYLHIWRPTEYPIIDERVWRVFCTEEGRSLSKSTKPRSWKDFEAYKAFFTRVMRDTCLDWRTIDQGLWVLGNRLGAGDRRSRGGIFEHEHTSSLDHRKQRVEPSVGLVPPTILSKACELIEKRVHGIPFRHRGIIVHRALIETTMSLLNAESTKTLPQNSRSAVRESTPDGLDRRIKESLDSDLRTANIISDVLRDAGIVQIVQVRNPRTDRFIRGTRLLQEWRW